MVGGGRIGAHLGDLVLQPGRLRLDDGEAPAGLRQRLGLPVGACGGRRGSLLGLANAAVALLAALSQPADRRLRTIQCAAGLGHLFGPSEDAPAIRAAAAGDQHPLGGEHLAGERRRTPAVAARAQPQGGVQIRNDDDVIEKRADRGGGGTHHLDQVGRAPQHRGICGRLRRHGRRRVGRDLRHRNERHPPALLPAAESPAPNAASHARRSSRGTLRNSATVPARPGTRAGLLRHASRISRAPPS